MLDHSASKASFYLLFHLPLPSFLFVPFFRSRHSFQTVVTTRSLFFFSSFFTATYCCVITPIDYNTAIGEQFFSVPFVRVPFCFLFSMLRSFYYDNFRSQSRMNSNFRKSIAIFQCTINGIPDRLLRLVMFPRNGTRLCYIFNCSFISPESFVIDYKIASCTPEPPISIVDHQHALIKNNNFHERLRKLKTLYTVSIIIFFSFFPSPRTNSELLLNMSKKY